MSSSSNSQQQQQQDPHKDSWYPYSNGTKHFDGNIAMIIIFIFCALVCALAINTAIRFILRLSRAAASTNNNTSTSTSASASATQQQQQQHRQHDDIIDDYDKKPTPSMILPTLVFSSGTKMKLAGVLGAGATAECAICLSEFVQGEGVRILPKCKHGFHVKCIEGWLSAHVSCPTCRTTCVPSSPPPPPPPPHNYNYNYNYDVESQSSPNPNPCAPLPPLSAASEPLQRPMSE